MSDYSKYSTPIAYQSTRSHSKTAQAGQRAQVKKEYPALDWARVDVASEIERHTSTRLNKKGNTQLVGSCPFDDCSVDEDGFICWPGMSKNGQHFYCRGCRRSGDLIHLLRELKGWDFQRTLVEIGMRDEDGQAVHVSKHASKPRSQAEQWMSDQLDMLTLYYPEMQKALLTFERPKQYLASRGISLEDAQRYGLGYFPLSDEAGHKVEDPHLKGWFGRLIFPLSAPEKGITFAGRTLQLWQAGMGTAEHKQAIDAYNAALSENDSARIRRILKTSPCGHFGYAEAIKQSEIVVCEGETDALSLLIAGISGVVAMGTSLPAKLIPLRVEAVTLALDADAPGKDAAKRLSLDLADRGIEVKTVIPTIGKDWNDTYQAGGPDAILEAFFHVEAEPEPMSAPAQAQSVKHPLVDENMPEWCKTNECYRCGRYGEAAYNELLKCWACICSQLEDFETAQAGRAARLHLDSVVSHSNLSNLFTVVDERGFPRFCSFCSQEKIGIKYGQTRCAKHWDEAS